MQATVSTQVKSLSQSANFYKEIDFTKHRASSVLQPYSNRIKRA